MRFFHDEKYERPYGIKVHETCTYPRNKQSKDSNNSNNYRAHLRPLPQDPSPRRRRIRYLLASSTNTHIQSLLLLSCRSRSILRSPAFLHHRSSIRDCRNRTLAADRPRLRHRRGIHTTLRASRGWFGSWCGLPTRRSFPSNCLRFLSEYIDELGGSCDGGGFGG